MKKLFIATCIFFTSLITLAQESEDFQLSSYQITINKASDEAIKAINAFEGKEEIKVVFGKNISQEGFSKACKAFPWIKEMEVSYGNENINDISAMSEMKGLRSVTFKSLKATKEKPLDLISISQSKNLENLDFYATKVINTEALNNLTMLKEVSFYMSSVSSIDFVKSTPALTKLNLYGTGHTFENYAPLSSLPQLKELNIYMNPQATDENLKILESLTELRSLSMSNNNYATTLSFLKNSKDLRELRANWCDKLEDFTVLAQLTKLEFLYLSKTSLSTIDFLNKNDRITDLDISKTEVTDLTPIKDATTIKSLNISGLEVEDVTFISNYPTMYSLKLPESVPEDQISKIKESHPKLRIR